MSNRGRAHERACEVLKACRSEWVTATELGLLISLSTTNAQRWITALHHNGVLISRLRTTHKSTRPPVEYTISPTWRNTT